MAAEPVIASQTSSPFSRCQQISLLAPPFLRKGKSMLSELGNITIDLFKIDNGRIRIQADLITADSCGDSTGLAWNVVLLSDGL